MKNFLLILFMTIVGFTCANAQVLHFRSDAYCQKYQTSYGWTNWSDWEKCNVSITINTNTDQVIIYSNKTQRYQIVEYTGNYTDSGAQCCDFRFYDQDGDRGTMTLVVKPSGQSEIYIRFANIQWAYIVHRTY